MNETAENSMNVKQLEHVNIQVPGDLMDEVKTFYIQFLGMTEGFRPAFEIAGAWLYRHDVPVVHLTINDAVRIGSHSGPIHHVAFGCEGLDAFRALFEANGLPYDIAPIPSLAMTQLFLQDPVGTCIELSFREELQG